MKQLILTTSSTGRKTILDPFGLKYKFVPNTIEKKLNPRLKPRSQVEVLSREMAEAIMLRFPDAVIIATDTLIVFHDDLIGKPVSLDDAKRTLSRLSGRTHVVMTGFTILDTTNKRSVTKSAETEVTIKRLTQIEIDAYVATGEPFEHAGGYDIQGKGAVLVEKIAGDYYTVIGLPICLLADELKRFGIRLF